MLLLGLVFVSCAREQEEQSREESIKLYRSISSLAETYIDSLENAKDTLALNSLMERFENRLDDINYAVIPDTDYSLSEDENDTIFMLLTQVMAARRTRMEELLSRRLQIVEDSLSQDDDSPTSVDSIPPSRIAGN